MMSVYFFIANTSNVESNKMIAMSFKTFIIKVKAIIIEMIWNDKKVSKSNSIIDKIFEKNLHLLQHVSTKKIKDSGLIVTYVELKKENQNEC